MSNLVKICKQCGNPFEKAYTRSLLHWSKAKYFSFECYYASKRDKPPWNKGKQMPEGMANKMRILKLGVIPWNRGLTKETDSRIIAPWEGKEMPEGFSNKLSIRMLTAWQNPEFVAKQIKARNRLLPNRAELQLLQILSSPWKFVGDGQLVIGGKCPDFWNGDHQLIELYGDYWHSGDNPEERIDHFAKYGYNCLVIWEHELQDTEQVKAKVANV